MKNSLVIALFLMVTSLFTALRPAQAMGNGQLELDEIYYNFGDCNNAQILMRMTWIAEDEFDGPTGTGDGWAMVYHYANSLTTFGIFELPAYAPAGTLLQAGFNLSYSPNIDQFPFTMMFYDLNPGYVGLGLSAQQIVANYGVLMDTAVVTESDVPPCGEGDSGGESEIFFDDGRIQAATFPTVIYPVAQDDGYGIEIYGAGEDSTGYLVISLSAAALAEFPEYPATNIEIARSDDGEVVLYKLTTGEYQVSIGPDAEGKVHIIIFDGLPPTTVSVTDFYVGG